MKKLITTLFTTCAVLSTAVCEEAHLKEKISTPLPGKDMNMSSQTYEAKILKVYTAKSKKGTKYNGYVVQWNGSEIVVSDMFGGETKKEGDKIEFMVQEIDMPSFDPEAKGMKMSTMLQIMVVPSFDHGGK